MSEDSLEEFYSYLWHKKWPDDVLNDPALASRRKRSHSLKMISLDKEKIKAVFQSGSNDARIKANQYVTTLTDCTCRDFFIGKRKRPCKHILRLAEELGLFQNELFSADEHDYTMGSQEYFLPKIPYELVRKLEVIALREGRTLSGQINIFLEDSLKHYLNDKCLEFSESNSVYELVPLKEI